MHGEEDSFEWSKTLRVSQIENCRDYLSLRGPPHSSKYKLQHIKLSDMTGTSKGTGFYGQMKQTKKKVFLAANHQMFLVKIVKKYRTVKYTSGSLMLRANFCAGGPRHLVQIRGIMDSSIYQQIKNENLTVLPSLKWNFNAFRCNYIVMFI